MLLLYVTNLIKIKYVVEANGFKLDYDTIRVRQAKASWVGSLLHVFNEYIYNILVFVFGRYCLFVLFDTPHAYFRRLHKAFFYPKASSSFLL